MSLKHPSNRQGVNKGTVSESKDYSSPVENNTNDTENVRTVNQIANILNEIDPGRLKAFPYFGTKHNATLFVSSEHRQWFREVSKLLINMISKFFRGRDFKLTNTRTSLKVRIEFDKTREKDEGFSQMLEFIEENPLYLDVEYDSDNNTSGINLENEIEQMFSNLIIALKNQDMVRHVHKKWYAEKEMFKIDVVLQKEARRQLREISNHLELLMNSAVGTYRLEMELVEEKNQISFLFDCDDLNELTKQNWKTKISYVVGALAKENALVLMRPSNFTEKLKNATRKTFSDTFSHGGRLPGLGDSVSEFSYE